MPLACSITMRLFRAVCSCSVRVSRWWIARCWSSPMVATSASAWPRRSEGSVEGAGLDGEEVQCADDLGPQAHRHRVHGGEAGLASRPRRTGANGWPTTDQPRRRAGRWRSSPGRVPRRSGSETAPAGGCVPMRRPPPAGCPGRRRAAARPRRCRALRRIVGSAHAGSQSRRNRRRECQPAPRTRQRARSRPWPSPLCGNEAGIWVLTGLRTGGSDPGTCDEMMPGSRAHVHRTRTWPGWATPGRRQFRCRSVGPEPGWPGTSPAPPVNASPSPARSANPEPIIR